MPLSLNTTYPDKDEVVKIDGNGYLHLYRGTSFEWLNKDECYLDNGIPISFSTNIEISKLFSSHEFNVTPIVMDLYAPVGEVDFGDLSILPRVSKMFSPGYCAWQYEYWTIWKVPKSLMRGYWNLETGEYIKNNGFNPDSDINKMPLSALAPFRGIYEDYKPEELDKLRKIFPDIDNWWTDGFKEYVQLSDKVRTWGCRGKEIDYKNVLLQKVEPIGS